MIIEILTGSVITCQIPTYGCPHLLTTFTLSYNYKLFFFFRSTYYTVKPHIEPLKQKCEVPFHKETKDAVIDS